MDSLQSNTIESSLSVVKYRFMYEKLLKYGQAVYIVGSPSQLGQWNTDCAVRLECYLQKYWFIDIQIPIDTQIEYKFFISSHHYLFQISKEKVPSSNWIGNDKGMNFRLFLVHRQAVMIQKSKKQKDLKIMSFNIRYENKIDLNQLHWQKRKQNCLQVIKQNFPSILGIQEAQMNQKLYLQQKLSHLYNYIGAPRDNHQGEEVGIFYDKQRFILLEYGFRWISESKNPGSIGFGASYPRYFTYLILEDTYNSKKIQQILNPKFSPIDTYLMNVNPQFRPNIWIPRQLIMVQNVHLDHISGLAQKKGVQFLDQEIKIKKQQYKGLISDVFIIGDFNTNEQNHIFNQFTSKIESIRGYFARNHLKNCCDYKNTFNGFSSDKNGKDDASLTIDHLFISNEIYTPEKFQVIRSMVHQPKNPKQSFVSDHFPILGTFKPKQEVCLLKI